MEIRNFSGNGVQDISISVRHGEILGLGGLVGAGRTELAQLIYGFAKLKSGELLIEGKKAVIRSPRDAVALKIGLIPEDRKSHGLLLGFDVMTNISLPSLRKFSHLGFVNRKREIDTAQEQRAALQIKTPSMRQITKNLSGGNQQKVVLAKWLVAQCDYLIFDEPTRGIDVGAKQEIYKLLRNLAAQGKCIIMISSEMEELMGISDRIIILCEGRCTGELKKEEFGQEKILALASGEKVEVV
jgi:ABC-type sugar transport system ATPase subunit